MPRAPLAWLMMWKLALAWMAFGSPLAHAQPARPSTPQPRTHYALNAQLVHGEVRGTGTIVFVNASQQPLSELVFHLYANAFASRGTVFAREGGLSMRGLPLSRTGGIELSQLRTQAGLDLLARAKRELVAGDRTQLRTRLSEPLAPGATLTLHTTFVVRLPSLVARMGRARDFHMIAQWFPKLARLLPSGVWSSAPYHGAGEFDADFADYELSVEVPDNFTVAAPGERLGQSVTSPTGRRIERFRLQRARDIAWAAAPALIVAHAKRAHVAIDAYAPRGYSALAARQAERIAHWLEVLERLLGPYPHDRLVLVIPPHHARGAAGMEYPGLIVGADASPWDAVVPIASAHDLVTAHELAHQWFPMLINSDEVASPVLDEGLAEWLGLHLLRDDYSRRVIQRLVGVPFDAFDVTAALLGMHPRAPSSLLRANEVTLRELAPAMYWRPAIVLERIAAERGIARLERTLQRYARSHRFEHVALEQLSAAFDDEYGPGFAKRELLPALAGSPVQRPAAQRTSPIRQAPRSLLSRMVATAQHLLSWVGP